MKTEIKKLNEIFEERLALRKSLKSLEKKLEIEIEEQSAVIFNDLKEELDNIEFILCIHGHYDNSRVTVLKRTDEYILSMPSVEPHPDAQEWRIEIADFKIASVHGSKNKDFLKAIQMVENYLTNLNSLKLSMFDELKDAVVEISKMKLH